MAHGHGQGRPDRQGHRDPTADVEASRAVDVRLDPRAVGQPDHQPDQMCPVSDAGADPLAGREDAQHRQPGVTEREDVDRHREDEVQIHLQVGVQHRQHAHDRQRTTAGAQHARHRVTEREAEADLTQPREHPTAEEQRRELSAPDLALDGRPEEEQNDRVPQDVEERGRRVSEHAGDPGPDVLRIARG